MRIFAIMFFVIGFVVFSSQSDARPVSYPDGTTLMLMNNGDMNSVHAHYSPTAQHSIGYRGIYFRDREMGFNGAQLNYLVNRWNMPASQANIYFKSGLGVAYSDKDRLDGETEGAGFAGFAMDWEDRRYFTSYENQYMDAGKIDSFFEQRARVGVAPYIGDYGDLHTWLMLEVENSPQDNDQWTVTPLIRMFKGVHLWEAGMNDNGEFLFNYVVRY